MKPRYKPPSLEYDSERPTIRVPDGFILVQDTREGLPLFDPASHIIDKGLKVGDYSIVGFEKAVTIERKSLNDLYSSLGKGRDNFDSRILKMRGYTWAGLLIEGTEEETLKCQMHSQMQPNQIYHALSSYEVDGIHIYYAADRDRARDWVLSRLIRFWLHVRRGDIVIEDSDQGKTKRNGAESSPE